MIVAFLCFLFVALAAAGVTGPLTGADQTELLRLHNYARANPTSIGAPAPATKLNALSWDNNIAAAAQGWANQCNLAQSTNWANRVYGENWVYMYPPEQATVQGMFPYFTNNVKYFNFATKQCTPGYGCAAFQQVMDSKTTHVGCATAICNFNGVRSTYLVCNYKVFAQWTGTRPYEPAGTQPPTPAPTPAPTAAPKPPVRPGYNSIDYRNTYLVQAVKDQRSCGSCWAFSAVAMAESAISLARGSRVAALSEQSVLDCSSSNNNCGGGWPIEALNQMVNRKGVDTMSSYAYQNAKYQCRTNSANFGGAIRATYTAAKGFDATYQALQRYGPLGIVVWADANSWNPYRSGKLGYDANSINHAVTLVGYDSQMDAWIVRNSWGPSWGVSGHIYLDAQRPCGAYLYGAWYATA